MECAHHISLIGFQKRRIKGELTKKFLFLFSLDQVSLISLLKYFPQKNVLNLIKSAIVFS